MKKAHVTLTVALVIAAAHTTPSFADDPSSKALFGTDCGLCHQRDGNGVPGQFPRLAGRIGMIAANPEGKLYLTHVLAAGMIGAVTVDDHKISGYMPAFGQVPSTDIAAILTYASGLGGTSPVTFTAGEVQAGRDAKLSAQAVHEERLKLSHAKIVP